ncbi:MAG: serine/threonine-protein phosphatase, partial [Candidatus Gracilibacteria bacterium]|nr:serine/threonine-protein phosphatase [Candidatus Gracilibacteria bacterium]
ITGIFFSIDKNNTNKINLLGFGHEPLFIYRKKENKVEKIVVGGLAMGIRLVKDENNLKEKSIELENGDILFSYTDGIIEIKNQDGEMFGFDRLEKKFLNLSNKGLSLSEINYNILKEIYDFSGKDKLDHDDVSLLFFKRDFELDFLNNKEKIKDILKNNGISFSEKKLIQGKNLKEALVEIEEYNKKNSLKLILKNLDNLYRLGELPKLKTECVRYIKEGYIHHKLNFYLKKSIENEFNFKIKQKNKKVQDKYNVLKELYKRGEFQTVIEECSDIIQKDGNL